MKVVIQRVLSASVEVNSEIVSKIGNGYLVYLGIKTGDSIMNTEFLAKKCCSLRVFEDENEKMNLSLKDVCGELLVVSQFTLYGDAQKGNRPSFTDAAKPDVAIILFNKFVQICKNILGEEKVKTGRFREMMKIESVNFGPVTILIEN